MQNWETARETAATIVVGKGGRSKESTAARLLSSRSVSTTSQDSAPKVHKKFWFLNYHYRVTHAVDENLPLT